MWAFQNQVPYTNLICEISTNFDYFYYKCNDLVALTNIQQTGGYGFGQIVTLGYFLDYYLFTTSDFEMGSSKWFYNYYTTNNLVFVQSHACQITAEDAQGDYINGYTMSSIQLSNTPSQFRTTFCSEYPVGGWSAVFFGLNIIPNLMDGGTSLIDSTLNGEMVNTFIVDNTASRINFVVFGLSNILTSTISKSYTLAYASSTSYTQMFGFSLASSDGVKDVSSVTVTFSTQFTFQESTSTTSTVSSTVSYTESIGITGSLTVPPGCKMIINETISDITNTYLRSYILLNTPSQIAFTEDVYMPTGYVISSSGC